MNINGFYTDQLGADLRNTRWSWGSFDPVTSRVYLRVWSDESVSVGGTEYILVLSSAPRRRSLGYPERQRHLDLMREGAEGYGILCEAADPLTSGPRKIRRFDSQNLLKLGDLVEFDVGTYAKIVGRVPVSDLSRSQTSETTLAADLKAIIASRLSSTEREALLRARLGQGAFRANVLAEWDGQCAVTGVRTIDAVRASHIKPWRMSTNSERLDPSNGIPLVATLDALFDSGLITFDAQGKMLVSQRLSTQERERLGLRGLRLTRLPGDRRAEYLAIHVAGLFKG